MTKPFLGLGTKKKHFEKEEWRYSDDFGLRFPSHRENHFRLKKVYHISIVARVPHRSRGGEVWVVFVMGALLVSAFAFVAVVCVFLCC